MIDGLVWLLRTTTGWPLAGFAEPAWLGLAPPLLVWLGLCARRLPSQALAFPAWSEVRAAGARTSDPVDLVGGLLGAAVGLALVLVLAEPMGSEQQVPFAEKGLDLVLVLDASGSMRALDTQHEGAPRTRLDLAKEVVARFARHRVAAGDRVGLVVFGDSAFTQCPLSSDGTLLASALARVEAGIAGESTALGDALALAVKRLGSREPTEQPGPRAGRLVVLLTDGRSNAGRVPPGIALELARLRGVRVHTVGIGGEGRVPMADARGRRTLALERHDLDARALLRIARQTGGRYFPARSSADLASVYAEIDRLERVERETPPKRLGAPMPEPFLAAAGGLLALQILLTLVVARRLP